jgi:hypothetical protein
MSSYDPALQPEPTMPASESARVEHTRLRRRMLYGLALADVQARVIRMVGSERAAAQGDPDPTGLVFGPLCKSLATLYSPDPPRPSHPDTAGQLVLDAAQEGGLWDLMIRLQRDTIGLREMLVRVEPVEDPSAPLGWTLAYHRVFPDRVAAEARPGAADLPGEVWEAIQIEAEDGDCRWGWDVWCITDDVPYHRVYDEDRTTLVPITLPDGRVVDEEAGDLYPYRDESGAPVIPYSLYHAERTGCLWDPWEWSEIVEGSLLLAVGWTFWDHILFHASWPQNYMVGAFIATDTTAEDTTGGVTAPSRVRVVADPAKVLVLTTDPESVGQPQIGQFAVGGDPKEVAESLGIKTRVLYELAGVDPVSLAKASGVRDQRRRRPADQESAPVRPHVQARRP